MNMKQSCKALICAIEGELDGRHCTEEQAAAILDHALPSLTEALARMEAELAEALGEIRIYQQKFRYIAEGGSFYLSTAAECVRLTSSFLAIHAQAEQQEAQGTQAGEDVITLFERIISQSPADLDKATEDNPWYQVMASEVRAFAAALATQPAAGKPVFQLRNPKIGSEWHEVDRVAYEEFASMPAYERRTLWTAPPAAAHGDDTRRIDWLACKWRLGGTLPDVDHGSFREVIDAAMRAQGDGELQ